MVSVLLNSSSSSGIVKLVVDPLHLFLVLHEGVDHRFIPFFHLGIHDSGIDLAQQHRA